MSSKADIPAKAPIAAPKQAKPKRWRFLRKALAWLASTAIVLAIVIGLGILALLGREITAPDWARHYIEERADDAMPQMKIHFGEVYLTLAQGWRPHVRLQNIRLEDANGAEVLAFSEFEADFSMRALMRGEVKPKVVSITGVFANLHRDENGQMTLRGGTELSSPSQQATNLPELIESMDTLFSQRALSNFRMAEIHALTLRYEDARIARAWVVDGGYMRLTRTGDELQLSADLAVLSGGADVATVEMNYTSVIGDTAAEFGINIADVPAQDIATQSPALAWLDVLRAPISGALRSGVDSKGGLGPLAATLQIGAGVLQPTDETKPIPFTAARSYFTYHPERQLIDFAELSVESKWITTRAEGQALLGGLDQGGLSNLTGQFKLSAFSVNPKQLYAEPILLDGADMDFRLDLEPFNLKIGQMSIHDQGETLRFKGTAAAKSDGWRVALDGQMDTLTPDRLLELWPDSLAKGTRNWISKNLLAGTLSNADVALRKEPNEKIKAFFSFDFSDAKVRFLRTLPPMINAQGQASMLDNRFVAAVDAGKILAPQGGEIDVAGSSFIIPDVTIKKGAPSVTRLRTDSTITAALSLLNQEKLEVMDKADLSVTMADGRAILEGSVAVPLKKKVKLDEIIYDVQGVLRSVRSEELVKGKVLAADTLNIVATNTGVEIGGKGRLGQVPFDGTWSQAIGTGKPARSTLTGTVELSERTIDEFNIGLPKGSVSGAGQGAFSIVMVKDRAPHMELTSNLRGLAMKFAPLGWSKPASQAGSLSLSVALGAAPVVETMQLDAAGLKARGKITTTSSGGLKRASFERVQMGNWLDAPVTLIGQGKNTAPKIAVAKGTLDLRRAEFGAGGGGSGDAGGPMSIALNRLQITDTLALHDMRGDFTTKSGLDGTFTGRLNGGTKVSGRIIPQNGRSAVRITSEDAGGIFASAGLLKQARGGGLSLTLLPVGKDGEFDGKLTVKNTRIKDAPAIAALLNALSIVGLLEQMGGSGIHFNEIEAAFHLTPSTMTLTQASAVGPSMGISMDGVYAVDKGTVDMRGVISPIYLLNGIGSILTRKGEGLIGFNYSLSGAAENPKVRVNPLSALTPGMFRDLFRAPAPKLPASSNTGPPPQVPKALLPEQTEQPQKPRLDNTNVDDR